MALARHAGYARFAYNWALADFTAGLDADEWRGDRTLRPRWNAAKHAVAPWCGEMLQVVAKNAIRDLRVDCGRGRNTTLGDLPARTVA